MCAVFLVVRGILLGFELCVFLLFLSLGSLHLSGEVFENLVSLAFNLGSGESDVDLVVTVLHLEAIDNELCQNALGRHFGNIEAVGEMRRWLAVSLLIVHDLGDLVRESVVVMSVAARIQLHGKIFSDGAGAEERCVSIGGFLLSGELSYLIASNFLVGVTAEKLSDRLELEHDVSSLMCVKNVNVRQVPFLGEWF